jgi:hypothetical protein
VKTTNITIFKKGIHLFKIKTTVDKPNAWKERDETTNN